MTIDYDKLTDEIMKGMSDSKAESNSISKNIIKTQIGDNILCRLVPSVANPKNSLYHYYHHGWMTDSGQYVSYLCPSTNQETCPICKKSIGFYKSNNKFLQEASRKISRKENWLVNIYIVNDEKNPSNNGTVKIFRFGKQIKAIIDDAISGSDKDVFGRKIWRMDSNGCNFRISVKPNSDKKDAWPSYTASKFLPPSDLGLSDANIKSVIDSTYDLTTLFEKQLTYDELCAELQKNFIDGLQRSSDDDFIPNQTIKPQIKNMQPINVVNVSKKTEEEDDIPFSDDEDVNTKSKPNLNSENKSTSAISDEIDKMLEELG